MFLEGVLLGSSLRRGDCSYQVMLGLYQKLSSGGLATWTPSTIFVLFPHPLDKKVVTAHPILRKLSGSAFRYAGLP